jgi:AAA domain-containing protein
VKGVGVQSHPQRVVALLGVSGSGKSVVARRLYEDFGFTRLRFGDAVRDMLKAGFNLSDDDLDGPARYKAHDRFGGCTINQLVQSLAGDWARGRIHSDMLVNEWRRRIAPLTGNIISDDLQRPNEAAAVRALGGIVVRVVRPGFVPAHVGSLQRLAHIQADLDIVNDDPKMLRAKVDDFVAALGVARPAA